MKLFKKIAIAVFITYMLTILMLLGHTDNNNASADYDYKISNLEELPDTVMIKTEYICADSADTANIKSILPYLHIDTIDINNYKDPEIGGFFDKTKMQYIHI